VIAYGITVIGSEHSCNGYRRLRESHRAVGNEFPIAQWPATVPARVAEEMDAAELEWTYPWEGCQDRPAIGLRLHRYVTKSRAARMACFMSHFRLWRLAAALQESILILEDDALFVRKLEPAALLASEFMAIGINDPRGATRRANVFHEAVQGQPEDICDTPWIDKLEVPQGLAGASAYIMKPSGARHIIARAHEHGAWPNDALLCKQLCPWLGVTKTYYTRVQGTPTTL
jgi:hypothetical protein